MRHPVGFGIAAFLFFAYSFIIVCSTEDDKNAVIRFFGYLQAIIVAGGIFWFVAKYYLI
ncbi:MAG: hypothetical protein K2H53_00405 [Clostridia bacterium]|nr:hypothetical protein [Clostridia bacterium]